MKKKPFKMTRRQVLKAGLYAGAGMMLPWRVDRKAYAAALARGLSDPAVQPKFEQLAPNALNPGFLFAELKNGSKAGQYNLIVGQTRQQTGLRRNGTGPLLTTDVWGYGDDDYVSWPGRTLSVTRDSETTKVRVDNQLPFSHLLPVDTNLHWCYSLHPDPTANNVDYRQYSIKKNGVPIITHLHGGHTEFKFDGNPEFFYTPDYEIVGPSWFRDGLTGIVKDFLYDNDVPAGNLWYHDHALGITRLNVYAGMAGFYFVRDTQDTGLPDNPLNLPAYPYELAYAIQDRMFTSNGDLFYPAFPGDPFYDDFITGEGAVLPPHLFPKGGPTALAEFFGDHIVVNGKIWPRATTGDTPGVEPRKYRMRLLNGTDSRFMVIRFRQAASLTSTDLTGAGPPLSFDVIGSDQGLASSATSTDTLIFEPGGRYDIIFNFDLNGNGSAPNARIIMENIGGDAPFGGDYGDDLLPEDFFPNRQTDRVMAFDVTLPLDTDVPDDFNSGAISVGPIPGSSTRTRKVALFEGKDEFGRLQPLLGTAEPATNSAGASINWPATPVYQQAKIPDGTPAGILSPLVGQMEGSIAWHSPTTENPASGATEIWEIWNVTGDAHPVHLHLVNFKEIVVADGVALRQEINYDTNIDEDGFVPMFNLAVALVGAAETAVVVTTAIPPGDIPPSGTLRVVDDSGVYRVVDYTSYLGSTFIVPATDFSGVNASAGNNVYVTMDDGIFKVKQPTVQHNSVAGDASTYGVGFRIIYPSNPNEAYGSVVSTPSEYVENAPKDMVTALPDQITRIKATFDKDGRYVWHCHILSHEDHEMMRVLQVG